MIQAKFERSWTTRSDLKTQARRGQRQALSSLDKIAAFEGNNHVGLMGWKSVSAARKSHLDDQPPSTDGVFPLNLTMRDMLLCCTRELFSGFHCVKMLSDLEAKRARQSRHLIDGTTRLKTVLII
jgi:hypothetical protein